MPSLTTPATPGTYRSSAALSMWQALVPITITSTPGPAAPTPGTPACASITAALTGVPSGRLRRLAIGLDSRPAGVPGATIRPGNLSRTTVASLGETAFRYASDG